MISAASRICGALVCAGLLCAPAAGEATAPLLLAEPDNPGPSEPLTGASLFDEVFAHNGGADLPYPFERLLAALTEATAPAKPVTVLIPLGRSLQRFGGSPDYFDSPRVIVAVAADSGGPGRPFLKDRLFLGFQERAQAIEVISYNEAAGRFEFQVVEDYGPGLTPRVTAAERAICVACHQSHGPIFPTALWSETNANPAVASRLLHLGGRFNGAPIRSGVDQAEALDAATDRAARLAFVDAIWRIGCPGEAEAAARCRGDLLLNALLFRLAGSRSEGLEARTAHEAKAAMELLRRAPGGVGAPSPDIPNRDPLALVLAGVPPDDVIEAEGVFQPLRPRSPVIFFPAAAGGAPLSREIAAAFADVDILQLDRKLGARALERTPALRRFVGTAEARLVNIEGGGTELRLSPRVGGGILVAGHITFAGSAVTGGVVRFLARDAEPPARWLEIASSQVDRAETGAQIEVALREATLGLTARFPSGERILSLALRRRPDGSAEVEVVCINDLQPLYAAVDGMVTAAVRDGAAALADGPFRRRAVLRELKSALAAS